jgi:hypothetical protein
MRLVRFGCTLYTVGAYGNNNPGTLFPRCTLSISGLLEHFSVMLYLMYSVNSTEFLLTLSFFTGMLRSGIYSYYSVRHLVVDFSQWPVCGGAFVRRPSAGGLEFSLVHDNRHTGG